MTGDSKFQRPLGEVWADAIRRVNEKKLLEVEAVQEAAKGVGTVGVRGSGESVRAPAVPTSIASVMACIRAHESGDYGEHSHPNGSTGAYQYQGPTWRTWSARAGYPGYSAAYLAPPSVQDAVTAYALTHGGAGNWSVRYGPDPCTAGLPGGG